MALVDEDFGLGSGTVWIAYYDDWSGFALFANEIDALRYAVEKSMKVRRLLLPITDVKEAVRK